jgi:hypothetical protein
MFFTDRERQIYRSRFETLHDPVELYNKLEIAAGNSLGALLTSWWGETVPSGERAAATLQLAQAARQAFGCKPFTQPDGRMDADVLEALYHFLQWREGKD